jgi:hypothetical protein
MIEQWPVHVQMIVTRNVRIDRDLVSVTVDHYSRKLTMLIKRPYLRVPSCFHLHISDSADHFLKLKPI